MGRTLPSATVVFMQEEAAFGRFRRALRRSDQLALDDLFVAARQHLAAAQYAAHALPFEVFLLSMLLEEHKEVMKLRERVETLSTARAVDMADGGSMPPRPISSGHNPATLPGYSQEDAPFMEESEDKNDSDINWTTTHVPTGCCAIA